MATARENAGSHGWAGCMHPAAPAPPPDCSQHMLQKTCHSIWVERKPHILDKIQFIHFFFPKIIQFPFSQTLSLLNPCPAGRMLHREPSQHPWVPRHHPAFTVPVSPTPTRGHPMPPAPQSSALMGHPRASFPPQPSLCDLAVGCGAGTATPDRPHPHLASLRSPLPAAGLPNGLYKHRKRGYFPKRTKEKKKSVRGCFTGSAPSVGQGWWGHGRTLQGQPACHPRGSAWYCYDGKGEKKNPENRTKTDWGSI